MSISTADAPQALPSFWQQNRNPFAIGLAATLLAVGAFYLGSEYGWRRGALYIVGALLGLTLYHASFGFTGSWRNLILNGKGAGLRAQMAMLALAVLLFFPVLSAGEIFGQRVFGFVNPVGTAVLVGAFIFGIGMQLGGACASGTLFTVGGGNSRMVITLVFFVIGSVLATHHLNWWYDLPSLGRISMVREFGWLPALVLNLALFAAIAALAVWIERRRHGKLASITSTFGEGPLWRRMLRGPWPLLAGALALAVLNFATLLLAGRPWGVTSAFALWGGKWFDAAGIDVAAWSYWQNQTGRLEASVFNDTTSVMNFGIMLGALLAAGLAGKYAPTWRIPLRSIVAAVIGGLMLGYGARLAFGCNIGAFFSGVSSGSVHGWLWLASAFLGNLLGTRIRPLFRLPN